MISIANNGMITMHAGDSFEFPLYIDRGTKMESVRYKLRAHDTIYFVICEPNQEFNNSLVRKTFSKKDLNEYDDVVIKLDSTDTEYILEGQYYYEIKIRLGNGAIDTIVPRRKFIIY